MKNKFKKKMLLCMILTFLLALSATGCGKEEPLNFEVEENSLVKLTQDIIVKYYGVDETQVDYYLNDGTELEKSAVSGFIAAEDTDHVGHFIGFKEGPDSYEIKNGANGKVNCSVYCTFEHRDVRVTVSYSQNRKIEIEKAELYDNLSRNAEQYGLSVTDFIMQVYGQYEELDMTSVDSFLESYLYLSQNETAYNAEECEVSAVYSKKELIAQAGKNTIIGMGVVFVVLIFISFVISLLKYLPLLFDAEIRKQRAEQKKAQEEAKKKTEEKIIADRGGSDESAEQSSDTTVILPENESANYFDSAESQNLMNDSELVAVITAAIYAASAGGVRPPAYTASNDKLVVRSIRRVK
ncbi:MAG: OadG family protein [Eubacterium sp.]|nr:OadG family protein [Eubacterium sp.]